VGALSSGEKWEDGGSAKPGSDAAMYIWDLALGANGTNHLHDGPRAEPVLPQSGNAAAAFQTYQYHFLPHGQGRNQLAVSRRSGHL